MHPRRDSRVDGKRFRHAHPGGQQHLQRRDDHQHRDKGEIGHRRDILASATSLITAHCRAANSTVITNNISGTGIFTNGAGATTILSGSNSFTGNVYIDTLKLSASCRLVISNTYALNGTTNVTITGDNTTTLILANNNNTPTTTSINIRPVCLWWCWVASARTIA